MLICDYNGWADAPEDEREALDAVDLGPAWGLERRRRPRASYPNYSPDPTRLG